MYKVRQDTDQDRTRKAIAKVVRQAVRLHFSLQADYYINKLLPDILEEHALATAKGEEFTLDLSKLDLPALPEGK